MPRGELPRDPRPPALQPAVSSSPLALSFHLPRPLSFSCFRAELTGPRPCPQPPGFPCHENLPSPCGQHRLPAPHTLFMCVMPHSSRSQIFLRLLILQYLCSSHSFSISPSGKGFPLHLYHEPRLSSGRWSHSRRSPSAGTPGAEEPRGWGLEAQVDGCRFSGPQCRGHRNGAERLSRGRSDREATRCA